VVVYKRDDVAATTIRRYVDREHVRVHELEKLRMLWVEALARKSDVFGAFPRFKAAAENESGKHIQKSGPRRWSG
jgi:hypothetical protein